MKLNTDCIREVMLEIEKLLAISTDPRGNLQMGFLDIEDLYKALPGYSKEDIFYTLSNLEQAGYVDLNVTWADGGILMYCEINCMTYAGHEFLAKIRDSQRWKAVKNGVSAIRDYSLSAIASVAEGIANAAISKFIDKIEL